MKRNIASLQKKSHKRLNILTGEWVLVSPHRTKRPWLGQKEIINKSKRPYYDANCYLCPGNDRAGGERNPEYQDTFAFYNDFAALQTNSSSFDLKDGFLQAQSEFGFCKVICFSPDHSLSLADMEVQDIQKVIFLWQEEFKALGSREGINYVQIFENKGAVMGCSNPHPHGQIWSQSSLPNEVLKKDANQLHYYQKEQSSLLGDYLIQELEKGERIIYQNKAFVILIPFWAIWPFEAMIVPKKHCLNILEITRQETYLFAQVISVLTKAYDRLFDTSFPYSSGIHQAPTNGENNRHWHWHMSFYPPLLRSATVKKFMVGYEMFGMPQRDILPEKAAEMLKQCIK